MGRFSPSSNPGGPTKIKKYGISITRGRISKWYGTPGEIKFSDYAFVSPSIEIADFKVPDIEVSDHLPLVIEFS